MTPLVLVILVPLVAALLVSRTGAWPNLREAISLVAGGILFFLVLSLLPSVLSGERPSVWSRYQACRLRFVQNPWARFLA